MPPAAETHLYHTLTSPQLGATDMALEATSYDNQLTAVLKASPALVRRGQTVTLTVTFPAIREWSVDDQREVYECFLYSYDLSAFQMSTNDRGRQARFKMPSVAEGDNVAYAAMTIAPGKAKQFDEAFRPGDQGRKVGLHLAASLSGFRRSGNHHAGIS